jgi:hypothetical protein
MGKGAWMKSFAHLLGPVKYIGIIALIINLFHDHFSHPIAS